MSDVGNTRQQVVGKYRARARRYDITANLYYLIGFRESAYRRRAIEALRLRRGDTVVESGCGTGLNFSRLEQAIGHDGRIIGVDLTDAMLEQAERRVHASGWTNVSLVQADALEFEFPPSPNAIFSTFALSLVPECGEVVARGSAALAQRGRWVVLDLQVPEGAPRWLVPLLLPMVKPFAVTEDVVSRRPWRAIRESMKASLSDFSWKEMFLGVVLLADGTRRPSEAPRLRRR